MNKEKIQTTSSFEFNDKCIEAEEETDVSTHLRQMQKNHLLNLQQRFERYFSTLSLFEFISGKHYLNLINSYFSPYLICERDVQPTAIKTANLSVSFKFGDVQFLDNLNFLGGATFPDSYLKIYVFRETEGLFPCEWFDSPDKFASIYLSPYVCFFSKQKDHNILEEEFNHFKKWLNSGLSQQQILKKLRVKEVPPSRVDNYNYLRVVWEEEHIST